MVEYNPAAMVYSCNIGICMIQTFNVKSVCFLAEDCFEGLVILPFPVVCPSVIGFRCFFAMDFDSVVFFFFFNVCHNEHLKFCFVCYISISDP